MQHPQLGVEEVVASPINISGYSKDIRLATPDSGAHTNEILATVGYSQAEIDAMRKKGIV